MGSGGKDPRGARYWVITAVITWLLLMTPMPFTLLAFGWLVYRVRKYLNDGKKLTSKVGARYMNIMLRNGKNIINAEVTDEDDKYIKVVDASGKELLINKNDVSILEPIEQDPMD
jgi:small nuclear ribonucleoprotein (snRNP)-like protein